MKSEREKQIPYANTYIWNLKKKKKGSDEPREQRCRLREWTWGHGEGEGEAETKWESSIDIYRLPNVK